MIADTTAVPGPSGGLMDGTPTGVLIRKTQRYDAYVRAFFAGGVANTKGTAEFGVLRGGAFVRFDNQQFTTDVNGDAEIRMLVLASLMQAGDVAMARLIWQGATTGSIINTNVRVAGHFKSA
jgi:hypothetical protein